MIFTKRTKPKSPTLLSILKAMTLVKQANLYFRCLYRQWIKMEDTHQLHCWQIIQRHRLGWKTRELLNTDALIAFYYSFIYLYLCYCDHVWGSNYVTNLQKLVILHKRIIRMIIGAKPRDHTEPMFLKLPFLKFADVNKYLIAVFMHHYPIARISDVFIDYFKRYKMFIIVQHEAV